MSKSMTSEPTTSQPTPMTESAVKVNPTVNPEKTNVPTSSKVDDKETNEMTSMGENNQTSITMANRTDSSPTMTANPVSTPIQLGQKVQMAVKENNDLNLEKTEMGTSGIVIADNSQKTTVINNSNDVQFESIALVRNEDDTFKKIIDTNFRFV